MSKPNFWNDQFTRPDPEKNPEFYHKVDLHDRQNDVAYHYHRSANQPVYRDGKIDRNAESSAHKHSRKYYERENLLKAVRNGDVEFVKSFIETKGFLKPTASAETDINRYFVHHHHQHHQSKQQEKTSFYTIPGESLLQPNKKVDIESDEEELDLIDETEVDNTGLHLLVEATIFRRAEIVKELLKIPNIATEQRHHGLTPLLIAARNHDLETLTVLLNEDKLYKRVKRDAVAVDILEEAGSFAVRNRDHHGENRLTDTRFLGFNALMFACHSLGLRKTITVAPQQQQQQQQQNNYQKPKINNEAKDLQQTGASATFHRRHSAFTLDAVLIDNDNQIHKYSNENKDQKESQRQQQQSLLQQNKTSLDRQVACIREILSHAGFHINATSADDRTALFIASGHCAEPRVIDVLIKAGAGFCGSWDESELGKPKHLASFQHVQIHPAFKYDAGSFPIHQMVLSGHLEHLKILIQHIRGLFPPIVTTSDGLDHDKKARKMLLAQELNICYPQTSNQKLTPLILACSNTASIKELEHDILREIEEDREAMKRTKSLHEEKEDSSESDVASPHFETFGGGSPSPKKSVSSKVENFPPSLTVTPSSSASNPIDLEFERILQQISLSSSSPP